MKLTRKLVLVLMMGMGVVLCLDAYFGMQRETDLLETDMHSDEGSIGSAFASAAAQLWSEGAHERARRLITDSAKQVAPTLHLRWIDAVSPDGQPPPLDPDVLARLARGEPVSSVDRESDRFGRSISHVPVRVDQDLVGVIEITESLESVQDYIRSILAQRAFATALLMLLSGFITLLIGRWLIGRPVRLLVEKARRVGAGDFGGPLQLRQRDEIGELGQEINTMCDKLDAANQRIASETAARIAAIEQLRHADRLATVGQLASGIAHELGTPLNVVAQRAKMIASGEVLGTDAQQGARVVFDQTQRITAIIRQLLDFARRRSPHKLRTDVRLIAEQTSSFLQPLARKRSVAIDLKLGPDPVRGELDPGQIQQVLTNLMMNAIQAMPQGGRLEVMVGRGRATPPADQAGAESDYLQIAVRDTGTGIPTEILPHIFEPFFTTKDVGEGTGLGLAVTYGIAREHHGWVSVESKPGAGSCFTLYLPAAGIEAEVAR
jgi:signal transduction histidine kinase